MAQLAAIAGALRLHPDIRWLAGLRRACYVRIRRSRVSAVDLHLDAVDAGGRRRSVALVGRIDIEIGRIGRQPRLVLCLVELAGGADGGLGAVDLDLPDDLARAVVDRNVLALPVRARGRLDGPLEYVVRGGGDVVDAFLQVAR